jgi:hypothetical protein
VGLTHVAVLGAAVAALLTLPRVVFGRRGADESAPNHHEWGPRGWIRPVEETQALHALDRAMQTCGEMVNQPPAPALDEIVSDLRRLDRQRRSGPTLESERWLAAVVRAYDDRLGLACRCVGVSEHLEPLEGMDREIERVRVEGALQEAGVALRERNRP